MDLRERVRTLRQDLRHLGNTLAGRRPPISISRGRRETARAAQTLATRRVRIEEIRRETPDAVTLVLADLSGAPFSHAPGQFYTLLVRLDGELVRRAYSACTPDGDRSRLWLTAKRIAGGRVSSHLHQGLAVGETLELLGPSGAFVPASGPAHRVLIAGGSGITPMVAIAEWALSVEPDARLTLLYGNRGEADVIFRRRLDDLAARHAGRLEIVHVLSEPPPGWTGAVGILDRPSVARLIAPLPLEAEYFLCGPEPMMDAARGALVDKGVPSAAIKEERFTQPHLRQARRAPTAAQRVAITKGGVASLVTAQPGQTLLDAGLAAGIPMPYSCTMGGCGACKVKLVAGEIEMEEPNCLSPGERAAGEVLACVGRPVSGDVRIVLGR